MSCKGEGFKVKLRLGYFIFQPYRGMEENFPNSILGLEFQAAISESSRHRKPVNVLCVTLLEGLS